MHVPTRRFGRTEIQMPVFSCGGMRYQQSWEDVAPEAVEEAGQRNLEATILRALELGINHIETARGYGSSEMQLGWILPKLPRDQIIVQTKIAPFATVREFRETFEKSMRLLRLDHVDLLSLHGINDAELLDWSLRKGGCLDEARKIQREGRARHIGFSTHATCDIIVKAIDSDGFDYVNLHWYFVNDYNWPAIQAATAHDMGVFIISPNDKGGKLYAPPEKLRALCAPLTPMQWNDLYCLARPEVHTLSLGAARPEDFEEHVAGLAICDAHCRASAPLAAGSPAAPPTPASGALALQAAHELSAPIAERLRGEIAAVFGPEWLARGLAGLPSHVDVPGGVNVQEILRLWTYAKPLDLIEWGKMRYNLLNGAAGHWFPGNDAAHIDEPALRRALEGHPFAEKVPAYLREAHAALLDAPKKRLSEGGE